ncbi:MAG: substrate-binding domain-containing protein [Actinomycetota bacterium]|nr:substrate-binding domain-containing protein [Actinomycetota bacterium]
MKGFARMRRRTGALLILLCAVGIALVAAGASGGKPAGSASPLVAFLLPENVTVRWESNDKPLFTKELRRLVPGVRIDVLNALNRPQTQQSQAEAELTKGAKVLVVAPIDQKAFAVVARRAAAQKVKVVAYDRLIRGAPIAAYDSFDGVAVGKAQGRWLKAHTKKGARIAIINGSFTDDNAHLFQRGYLSILNPLFRSKKRIRVGPAAGTWTDRWDPPTAQREMEQLLTRSRNRIDGVLSANDGMAGGIIAALRAARLAGKVPVTGQDATVEGLQRILIGTQGQTVLKDFRRQAKAAARITAALLRGRLPKSLFNKRVSNGAGRVPSVILPVRSIDRSNITALINGSWLRQVFGTTKAKFCRGVPKRGPCK